MKIRCQMCSNCQISLGIEVELELERNVRVDSVLLTTSQSRFAGQRYYMIPNLSYVDEAAVCLIDATCIEIESAQGRKQCITCYICPALSPRLFRCGDILTCSADLVPQLHMFSPSAISWKSCDVL